MGLFSEKNKKTINPEYLESYLIDYMNLQVLFNETPSNAALKKIHIIFARMIVRLKDTYYEGRA